MSQEERQLTRSEPSKNWREDILSLVYLNGLQPLFESHLAVALWCRSNLKNLKTPFICLKKARILTTSTQSRLPRQTPPGCKPPSTQQITVTRRPHTFRTRLTHPTCISPPCKIQITGTGMKSSEPKLKISKPRRNRINNIKYPSIWKMELKIFSCKEKRGWKMMLTRSLKGPWPRILSISWAHMRLWKKPRNWLLWGKNRSYWTGRSISWIIRRRLKKSKTRILSHYNQS